MSLLPPAAGYVTVVGGGVFFALVVNVLLYFQKVSLAIEHHSIF